MKQIGYSFILIGTIGIAGCIAKVSSNASKRIAFAESSKAILNKREDDTWG